MVVPRHPRDAQSYPKYGLFAKRSEQHWERERPRDKALRIQQPAQTAAATSHTTTPQSEQSKISKKYILINAVLGFGKVSEEIKF